MQLCLDRPLWVLRGGMLLLVGIAAGCGQFARRSDPRTRIPPTPVEFTSNRAQKPDIQPVAASALPPVTLADGNVAVRAIAYVNGNPIFDFELRDAVLQRLREVANLSEHERSQKLLKIEQQELDRLIEREVILDEAFTRLKKLKGKVAEELQRAASKEYENWLRQFRTSAGLKSDAEAQEALASQGTSLENIRRQLERSFMAMEYMRNVIFPKIQTIPLADIVDYHRQHSDEFSVPDRVKWQAMFIDAGRFPNKLAARDYAEQMIAKLRGGEDFAALARKLSDSRINPLLSSDGIGEKRGEIQPPDVEGVLFQLEAGQIGSPIEMPGGFHIVRVLDRKKAGVKPLTPEIQAEIRRKLQNSLAEQEYRRLAEEMKDKAIVQVLSRQ